GPHAVLRGAEKEVHAQLLRGVFLTNAAKGPDRDAGVAASRAGRWLRPPDGVECDVPLALRGLDGAHTQLAAPAPALADRRQHFAQVRPGAAQGDEVAEEATDDRRLRLSPRAGEGRVHERDAADCIEDHDAVGRAAQRDGERLHLLAVAVAIAYELPALEGAGDD